MEPKEVQDAHKVLYSHLARASGPAPIVVDAAPEIVTFPGLRERPKAW